MKIMFISDIHGVKTNLDIIKKYDFDTLIILGDLYHSGYNESVDYIDDEAVRDFIINNRSKIICTKGNCDNSYDYLDLGLPENADFIKITDNSLKIYCSHGHKYNYHNLSFLNEADVVVYGHEHIPYIKTCENTIYICVGSISRPRNGSDASICIYDNKTFTLYSIEGQIIDSITKKTI